jgi:hypothetical protein
MVSPFGLFEIAGLAALLMALGILALRFPKRAAEIVEIFESTGALRLHGPSVRFVAIGWIAFGGLLIAAVAVYCIFYGFSSN